jgi:hypothetical protein
MKILFPAIATHKLTPQLQIQKKAESLPPLSLGEVVEAKIVESFPGGKALVSLKNYRMMANSDLPLRKDEKIAVRVAQLHPKVVLHIVHNKIPQKSLLMDYLRYYRSNPKALLEAFTEGVDRFSIKNLGALATVLEQKDVKNIQGLLKSLIFSRESLKNPFFFRDFVHNSGYLMEKGLGEALKKKTGRTMNLENTPQNLKGILIRMLDKLQPSMEAGKFSSAEKLAGFIRSSLKTIESHQVVNYMLQEYEGKYMFQIPLLFPENMGLAEIFVNFRDQDSTGKGGQGKNKLLFLLTMDVLGDIVVETKIASKKIDCTLKCADEKICDFIRPFLGELKERLMGLGYGIDCLKCVIEKDKLKTKTEHEFQNLFALESIDITA